MTENASLVSKEAVIRGRVGRVGFQAKDAVPAGFIEAQVFTLVGDDGQDKRCAR